MDAEVLIAGAGPVGLLLANLLGLAGISVLVLEKREVRARTSRAIGVTRTSLDILEELGLRERFLEEGLKVRTVALHAGRQVMARLEIRRFPDGLPFILALPQYRTERILLESLPRFPSVELRTGREVDAVREAGDGVEADARGVAGGERRTLRGRFLCACDGDSSPVRRMLGVARIGRSYRARFRMGDYRDRSGLEGEAHLFFTRDGTVESFPMGGGLRRWIVEVDPGSDDAAPLGPLVRDRTGFRPDEGDLDWESSFRPARAENTRYAAGRVIFCGDAAHTMPPIGGHGMNSGFGDAHLLARVLELALRRGAEFRPLLDAYARYRRRAFRSTAFRSWVFMSLGTVRRPALRPLRDLAFRLCLLPPLRSMVIRHFAMMNIPYSTLDKVLRREPALQAAGPANPA